LSTSTDDQLWTGTWGDHQRFGPVHRRQREEVVDIFGWGFPFYSPIYRTAIEWLPGGPPEGSFGPVQQTIANFLYHLYAFNIPRCGDVVTMLAHPKASNEGS
jgi:hypothetical protein